MIIPWPRSVYRAPLCPSPACYRPPQQGLESAVAALTASLGPVATTSPRFPFPRPEFYVASMGQVLIRQYISFAEPVDPSWLGPFKLRTNELERELAVGAPGI